MDIPSHVDMCLQNHKEYLQELDESDVASLSRPTSTFAYVYKTHGRYQEAEAMYERALAGSEKVMGPYHQSTVTVVNNLGFSTPTRAG
jgi:hypothetical protein